MKFKKIENMSEECKISLFEEGRWTALFIILCVTSEFIATISRSAETAGHLSVIQTLKTFFTSSAPVSKIVIISVLAIFFFVKRRIFVSWVVQSSVAKPRNMKVIIICARRR